MGPSLQRVEFEEHGRSAGAQSVAPGMENPYKTKNFTATLLLGRDNPELAKTLKQKAIRAA